MKQKIVHLVLFALIFSFSSPVFSTDVFAQSDSNTSVSDWIEQQNNSEENGEEEKEMHSDEETVDRVGIGVSDVIKSILALVFVLFLLLTVMKWIQRKNAQFPTTQIIRPIGGLNLGGNRSIQILKIGNKLYVIGVGETVELLKEIDEQSEIERISEIHNEQSIPLTGRKNFLKNVIDRFKGDFVKNNTPPSFQQEMESQLDRIMKERREIMKEKVERGTKDE
ncbi:flagellar biosynthetic protein FliO [Fervidibacillus albus]|uniref:Flagellar biosynthetic protein FliO n=1 Tax=Fervidibacillus albus TaxID=2980026 RepID=A0A9E8RWI5_9BACI|nr:flagellar biosynthetic protein FliO [Fervidibacillus albus]WAA10726.1 flagellar biosynthetic protein FliO [Fervidibacillus albus]